MMCSYHRLWLSMLVLALVTTSMCGFANEVEISDNSPHIRHADTHHHHLEAQAASSASLQEAGDVSSVSAAAAKGLSFDLVNSLRFEPNELIFGSGSVGTVRSHVVTLINQNLNHSVYLTSVSGRTAEIYSSFFEAKTIPPNGNTTFNVVFLPRDVGDVSTTLVIHTSFGDVKLLVSGDGRQCPYRIKPLVGIRAPLNATLMPEIHMYNPHGKPLEILEVYISGGQFKLELPNGDNEAPQELWEIPPFTTKPVIRIRFQGSAAGNYSAFIRIKIAQNHHHHHHGENTSDCSNTSPPPTKVDEQILVIPVEFEILSEYGMYAVNPLVEFGYITFDGKSSSQPLKHKLNLRHSKHDLEHDVNNLKFESLTFIKGIRMAEEDMISTVTINPLDISEPVTHLNEKLQLVLQDASVAYMYHNIEIIIRADLFKGSLYYDTNSTIFVDQRGSDTRTTSTESETHVIEQLNKEKARTVQLRNDFHMPLAIYNITTMPQNSSTELTLQLKPFEKIINLLPGTSWDLNLTYRLAAKEKADLKDLQSNYKTAIFVYTNVTNFQIPIVLSSTSLFVTTQTQTIWRSNNSVYTKELQLSSVSVREDSQDGYVILQNRNSLPIKLKDWKFEKVPAGLYYGIFARGCIKASLLNISNATSVDLDGNFELCDELQAGDVAVFVVYVKPYVTTLNIAYFKITTTYENITIVIKFSAVMGKLEVDQEKLHFTDCFPGKLCSSELSIRSTFKQPIYIKQINFTVPGLIFEDISPYGSKIAPQAVTTVGRMYFEPSALCSGSCYIPSKTDVRESFPGDITDKKSNIPPFNEVELRRRIELYRHFKYYFQNIDFLMTTKDMQHFQLNLMVELQWPQLATGRQVLPTIEVNKPQIIEVKIFNPSDQPILVDYHMADPALAKQTVMSLPLEVVILSPSCYLTDKPFFSLVTQTPKKPILIPALSSIKVPIRFQSDTIGSFCTMLHVRNNLTLYEGIWISAKAVQSQFRLGNRKPGSQTPLLFEITEQQLALACSSKTENEETQALQPQIVTRRVFTARNSGELPIKIDSFLIGDQRCRGYGFQVMNCSSFLLKANSSKTIEIVFYSDFTVTRISQQLVLKTNLSYEISYTLVAQLPYKGLDRCNALLARPAWEEQIRSITVFMLMVAFILVLIAVHIDFGNIMYQSSLYGARERGQIHPTFNLRNIAMSPSGQNNNETSSLENGSADGSQRSKTTGGLRKRNVNKNQKQSNDESTNTLAGFANTMTFSEMVSWTFGTKTTKKQYKVPKGKDVAAAASTEIVKNSSPPSASAPTTSDIKNNDVGIKLKLNEKSLIDKMDEDLKKAQQQNKKGKVMEKTIHKQDEKIPKEKTEDIEKRKEKSSKALTKTAAAASVNAAASQEQDNRAETLAETQQTRDQKKPIESSYLWKPSESAAKILPMTEITNQQQQQLTKECTNGRKMGKTPGRERRKQSAQNTSPANSSCSSNSTSSSAAAAAASVKRKTKTKASNSFLQFKFASQYEANANDTPSSLNGYNLQNGRCDQGTFYPDILAPWEYGTQTGINDMAGLQQENGQKARTSPIATLNSSPTALMNTDLVNHSLSLSDAMAADTSHPMHNSDYFGNLKSCNNLNDYNQQKLSSNDLGPIGSKKSPSSSPSWETQNHSAITMQLPRPLQPSTTDRTSYNQHQQQHQHQHQHQQQQQHNQQNFYAPTQMAQQSQYQQMPSSYGYNEQVSPNQAQKQHELDITAKLLEIQAHEELVRRYMEQLILHQQHQQYLNYLQAMQSDWSSTQFNQSSSAWAPTMDNLAVSNGFSTLAGHEPSLPAPSAWGMANSSDNSVLSASSSNGLARSSQIYDNNFPPPYMTGAATSSGTATSVANGINFSGGITPSAAQSAVSTTAPHSYGNNTEVSGNTLNTAGAQDNMPMFNLFGGLSSIWNDNWKQSTTSQHQQEEQEPQQKQQNLPQKKE